MITHRALFVYMKYPLFVVFLFNFSLSWSQAKRTTYSLEYTVVPIASKEFRKLDDKLILAHNVFLKAHWPGQSKQHFTTGIGFMNFHFGQKAANPGSLIYDLEYHYLHNYLVTTFGIQFGQGLISIEPQTGLAFHITSPAYLVELNQPKSAKTRVSFSREELNNLMIPFFLTVGSKIRMNEFDILIGMKGHVVVSNIYLYGRGHKHHFGIGLMIGTKF